MRSRFQRQRIPKPLPPHSSFTICHRKPPVPRSNVHRQPCAPTTAASAPLQLLNVPSLHAGLHPSVTALARSMSSSSHPDCDVTSPHAIHISTVPSHAWLQIEPFPDRTTFPLRSLKTMVFPPAACRNAVLPLLHPSLEPVPGRHAASGTQRSFPPSRHNRIPMTKW